MELTKDVWQRALHQFWQVQTKFHVHQEDCLQVSQVVSRMFAQSTAVVSHAVRQPEPWLHFPVYLGPANVLQKA